MGAFLLSLLMPEMKERILTVALGTSVGIILSRYVIKHEDK